MPTYKVNSDKPKQDWFLGLSWSNGLRAQVRGRSQQSSSEAIHLHLHIDIDVDIDVDIGIRTQRDLDK